MSYITQIPNGEKARETLKRL